MQVFSFDDVQGMLTDRRVAKALDEAREKFFKDPKVTSIGLGNRIVGGGPTGEFCVQVGVEKKLLKTALPSSSVLPRKVSLGPKGVLPLDVIETEQLAIQGLQSRIRPAIGGYSCGHWRITAGTIGAVLTDPKGQRYILSNNHVLADVNRARKGDDILQPGAYDGGEPPADVIAKLHKYIRIKFGGRNQVDCALAKAVKPTLLKPIIYQIGSVSPGLGTPRLGMAVQKSGRTTSYTTGSITRLGVMARINFGGPRVLFTDLIETTAMSQGGDSGSLVLDMDRKAVGLLFAGSSVTTLLCRIDLVISKLGISGWRWD